MKRGQYDTIYNRHSILRGCLLNRSARLLGWIGKGYLNPEIIAEARFIARNIERIDRTWSRIIHGWARDTQKELEK
jgi:hypothetical protein